MNCALHTDTAAAAYCRNCGRALCELCKRDVQGTIYCESCLAARMHGAGYGGPAAGPGVAMPPRPPEQASPGLALFLGLIPGVGAFYNGQFLKGFVQVAIFGTLIWLGDHGFGGLAPPMAAAWYFYMIFDAYTTAKARKYGLPLPDPLGLNAILEGKGGSFRERVERAGEHMGSKMEDATHRFEQHWQRSGAGGFTPPGDQPPAAGSTAQSTGPVGTVANAVAQAAAEAAMAAARVASKVAETPGQGSTPPPGAAGFQPGQGTYYAGSEGTVYHGPQGTYYQGPEGTAYVPPRRDHAPVGAVVLIGLGVILLLANLGWFSLHWISHFWPVFWPVVLIAIGLWLFVSRQRQGANGRRER
jgi:TM2 domain-containing membrane protein YozV